MSSILCSLLVSHDLWNAFVVSPSICRCQTPCQKAQQNSKCGNSMDCRCILHHANFPLRIIHWYCTCGSVTGLPITQFHGSSLHCPQFSPTSASRCGHTGFFPTCKEASVLAPPPLTTYIYYIPHCRHSSLLHYFIQFFDLVFELLITLAVSYRW